MLKVIQFSVCIDNFLLYSALAEIDLLKYILCSFRLFGKDRIIILLFPFLGIVIFVDIFSS